MSHESLSVIEVELVSRGVEVMGIVVDEERHRATRPVCLDL